MRNCIKMYVAAIAVLAAASCAKEAAVETPSSTEPVATEGAVFTITANISDVKAGIQDGYKVVWNQNDEIAVFDNTSNVANRFVVVSVDGKKAVFTGFLPEGAKPVSALYPYSSDATYSEGTYKFELPSSQSVSEGQCVDPKALAMCGDITGAGSAFECAFSNIVSLAKVTVSTEKFSEITLSGNNSEVLAGTVSYNAGTKEMTGASAKAVTLNTTVEDGFAAGDYFIAVAPSTLTKGIFLKSSQADGGKAFKSGANEAVFAVSHILPLGNVAIAGDWIPGEMTTVEHLLAWAKWRKQYTSDDIVKLGADIDMNGVTWAPVDFAGAFDGQNHKIYNFVQSRTSANAGFFGTVTGPVSNVCFGSKDGTTYDGVSKITVNGEGGWRYVGIVAKAQANLTGITTFVPVEFPSDNTLKVRGATLLGIANKEDIVIDGCVSYADLNCLNSATKTNNEAIFGGLIACCDAGAAAKKVYVRNCKYYGNAISLNPYTTCIGGIVGNCPSQKLAIIENCENFGIIAINTTATPSGNKEGYVGGIAGLLNGDGQEGTVLKGCTNHGNILCSGITVGNMGGIAGRIPSGKILDCTNEGDVTFDANVGGKALLIGGITGGMYKGGTVEGCVNKGKVTSNKNQNNRLGGIVGTVNTGKLSVINCTNSGACTISRTKANGNWQACGGIIGYQEKSDSFALENCMNSGKVTVEMENNTTHQNGVTAGGIIGLGVLNGATKSNINTADVTINVTGTTTVAYAGGISGWFTAASVKSEGDKSKCTVTLSAPSAGASAAGAALGCNAGSVKNPVIGGSVNGSAVTEANVATIAVGSGTAAEGATLYN